MAKIKNRNIALCILFGIVTFGIYIIYWFVKTKDEINSLGAKIPTAWLIIIPIVNWYWYYKYAEGWSKYVKKDDNAVMWFLLYLLLSPVVMIIFQMELNKLAG